MATHTTKIITAMKPGDAEIVIFPDFQGRDGSGLNTTVGLYEKEFGSGLFISINTEDMSDRFHDDDGEPDMTIMLNDATLYDYGTGDDVHLAISREAFAVLAGLIQPDTLTSDDADAINHQGIFSNAWGELRRKFPRRAFDEFFADRDPIDGTHYDPDYDPDAGM